MKKRESKKDKLIRLEHEYMMNRKAQYEEFASSYTKNLLLLVHNYMTHYARYCGELHVGVLDNYFSFRTNSYSTSVKLPLVLPSEYDGGVIFETLYDDLVFELASDMRIKQEQEKRSMKIDAVSMKINAVLNRFGVTKEELKNLLDN